MRNLVLGLTWASGLAVWLFIGAAALWPVLERWEDVVFLGSPILLMPHLLYQDGSRDRWDRLARALARMSLLAFLTLALFLFARDRISEGWFLGLVGMTLLAGPAMAAQAFLRLRLSRTFVDGCGILAPMLWMTFLATDLTGQMTLSGWIGLVWAVMHSVYAIGLAVERH